MKMSWLIAASGSALLLVSACSEAGASEAKKDACSYMHYMATTVDDAQYAASVGDTGSVRSIRGGFEGVTPPASILADDADVPDQLLEFVSNYRSTAIGYMRAMEAGSRVDTRGNQAAAATLWVQEDCGDATDLPDLR